MNFSNKCQNDEGDKHNKCQMADQQESSWINLQLLHKHTKSFVIQMKRSEHNTWLVSRWATFADISISFRFVSCIDSKTLQVSDKHSADKHFALRPVQLNSTRLDSQLGVARDDYKSWLFSACLEADLPQQVSEQVSSVALFLPLARRWTQRKRQTFHHRSAAILTQSFAGQCSSCGRNKCQQPRLFPIPSATTQS